MSKSSLVCQHCGSNQIYRVSAKCSDMCCVLKPKAKDWTDGYVPTNLKICADGDEDYINFTWCEGCGFILPPS